MAIYLDLTREFNAGALRAVICSGQAVVLHRLAIASKDGDWILREEPAALQHVLGVLAGHGARYRFSAPLAEAILLEMLDLMERDERRLDTYRAASAAWAALWPGLQRELEGLPLLEAHAGLVARASGVLPFEPFEVGA